jgi:hypothetical protein
MNLAELSFPYLRITRDDPLSIPTLVRLPAPQVAAAFQKAPAPAPKEQKSAQPRLPYPGTPEYKVLTQAREALSDFHHIVGLWSDDNEYLTQLLQYTDQLESTASRPIQEEKGRWVTSKYNAELTKYRPARGCNVAPGKPKKRRTPKALQTQLGVDLLPSIAETSPTILSPPKEPSETPLLAGTRSPATFQDLFPESGPTTEYELITVELDELLGILPPSSEPPSRLPSSPLAPSPNTKALFSAFVNESPSPRPTPQTPEGNWTVNELNENSFIPTPSSYKRKRSNYDGAVAKPSEKRVRTSENSAPNKRRTPHNIHQD